jgi:Na+-transporting methylmalonyl-CoA/oxaloacetate decarboxylase gamma subunit
MNEHAHIPVNHPSYENHRRQLWRQIILPLLLAGLLVVAIAALAGVATFGEGGDAPRWAAISTIWLVIPLMGFGLLFLVILVGLIYLLARALQVAPPYSAKAQYYVNRAASETRRISDLAVKPILFLEGVSASLKTLFHRS